jgi:DNA polymerase-3 subunit gamma/tau
MGYQVTARKWRPQTFDDVVEQRHVTRTLRNAIRLGRIAHAYLFAGTRGVGKTTMARVLAKALNCEQGPTEHPCNTCQSCLEITQGTSLDIVEIDGPRMRY